MRAVLFGKLPSHGDFVARGLGDGEVARWDARMSEGLLAARAALREGFDAAHGTAPPWRFVAREPKGAWSAGALAPSVDAAGRRFLVLLAVEDLDLAEAGALGITLAVRMEAVLYAALAESLDADAVYARAVAAAADAALDRTAAARLRAEAGASLWWTLGGERHAAQLVDADVLEPELCIRMLTPVRTQQEAAA